MDFWTLTGVAAIIAGLILVVRYSLRAYKAYTYTDPVDTLPEAKAVAVDAGKAALGLLILGIGIKLIVGAFLLLMIFQVAPAHARGAIIVCDQQGCRQAVAPGSIVTHPKIKKNIAARDNVVASQPVPTGKTVKILRGLAGEALSPMTDYVAPLRACGYRVELMSWTDGPQVAAVVIGHSMAMFPVLKSHARARFVIDGPIWAGDQITDHPKTANFPTFAHPHIHGAINVPLKTHHLRAPTEAKPYILSMLGCRKPRRAGR